MKAVLILLATRKFALVLCPTRNSEIVSVNFGLLVIAKKEEGELVRLRINTTHIAQFWDSVLRPRTEWGRVARAEGLSKTKGKVHNWEKKKKIVSVIISKRLSIEQRVDGVSSGQKPLAHSYDTRKKVKISRL